MKTFLIQSGLVEEAMGHPQAGGFTVKEEKLDELLQYIENNLPELEDKEPTVTYDLELNVSEVPEYIQAVEQFNLLTGNGFPKVIVRVNGITVESASVIGKTQETVKIKTFDNIELIKFKVNEHYASELGYFDTIDVVGQMNVNEWYNFATKVKTITNQVMLNDYRVQ
jgi:single-stranded-DNA-specific exonuclease